MNFGQILAEVFYTLIGVVFILVGVKALRDPGAQKKGTTAAFWFLLAFTFICGNWIPKWIVGLAIVAMAVLTGIKGVVQSASDVPEQKVVRERADKFGYKITAGVFKKGSFSKDALLFHYLSDYPRDRCLARTGRTGKSHVDAWPVKLFVSH